MPNMMETFKKNFPGVRKFLVKLILYIKYPEKLRLDIRTILSRSRAKKIGIISHEPNFIFMDWFDKSSVIIDVGCGYEADFSVSMIDRYGLKAFAVDPTRKHAPFLRKIEERMDGRFKHLALAVTQKNGKLLFNESVEHESGSVLSEHKNIRHDEIRSYEVESVNLKGLIDRIGIKNIDLIKLDIEGIEYQLLSHVSKKDIEPFRQIFVEFHHKTVPQYTHRHTKEIVRHIRRHGYEVFSADGRNYLFYKQGKNT